MKQLVYLPVFFLLPAVINAGVIGEDLLPATTNKAISVKSRKPNIVYIMSDELAYYEVGYNGAKKLGTPRIDQMANEGMIFTHAYAGAPVCAPLRASLMTGKHMGHCSVRANDGGTPLRADEATIASMLKKRGYATGGFGKWGAGGRDSTGVPEKHGFDIFFGYYDQVHAHSFYPPYLIRNSKEVPLEGNVGGRQGKTYSHYEIMGEALNFIRDHRDQPFFCYLPITPPHGMYDIPDSDPAWKLYQNRKDWPQEARRYAAMVKMVDRNVGQVLDLLKELNLDENTIVFFAGDNGGQDRFRTKDFPRGFFGPNVNPTTGVEFRGGKGNLYEGGLRIPSIVRWPKRIRPESKSDLVWYHPDLFPTLAEIAGGETPDDLDGISLLPTMLGNPSAQERHEYLYWEFGNQIAVRSGKWKAIRAGRVPKWALYDLEADVSENHDLAQNHPEILKRLREIADREHTPAKPGSYTSRIRHEKDRQAKWGTSNPPAPRLEKFTRWKTAGLFDSSKIKLLRVSSENKGNGKFAKMAFDGDPRTWWHSDWNADPKKKPHALSLDLGSIQNINGIRYLARQDSGYNGAIKDIEIQIRETPDSKAVSFTHSFQRSKKIQEMKIKSTRGRFLEILPQSEVSGNPFASAAEFGILVQKPSQK